MALLYISNGALYSFDGDSVRELKSDVLENYIEKLKSSAQRNEWKRSGEGAKFTGVYDPSDIQTTLQNLVSRIDSAVFSDKTLFFTQTIDAASGIYSKRKGEDTGIVQSDGNHIYRDLSLCDDYILVSAFFAGESHIGILRRDGSDFRILTEGRCSDRHPKCSTSCKNKIYYQSAGLLVNDSEQEQSNAPHPPFMYPMETPPSLIGPSSICVLDTDKSEITELLSDDKYDYIKPTPDDKGNLYFIRKPYEAPKTSKLGCLLDIILFPVRLIGALFGFLSVFSLKYSGKSLRQNSPTAAKTPDEKKIFIDGNLIDAEKAYKESKRKGDPEPGIIPQSYQLCRLSEDGSISVIARGVIAYALSGDDLYYSNGKAIIKLSSDGKSEKVCSADKVTFISIY